MYETMLRNLIPLMLVRLGAIPLVEKKRYAALLNDLCMAYLDNRRVDFARLLSQAQLPNGWIHSTCEALWREDTSK